MNKYSLRFKDTDLEQLYQQAVLKTIRTPILYLIGFIYSIQLICKIIVKSNAIYLHFMLTQLAAVLLLLIVAKLKPSLTILTLIILDHIIAYDQMCVNTSLQSAYINGSNCQLITTLIILTIDFKWGVLCNITTSIVKIFIAHLGHQLIDINDYLFSSMLFVFIIWTSYIVNKLARKHYLYNLKDTQWEKFLPVIDKTFFLFEYNDYLNRFEAKLTNSTNINLNIFLREAKCCNKTLEQHLFQRINKQLRASCLFESSFDLVVNFQKVKIQIKIYEYFLTKCTFLMVIQPDDKQNWKIIIYQKNLIIYQATPVEKNLIKPQMLIQFSQQLGCFLNKINLHQTKDTFELADLIAKCVNFCCEKYNQQIDYEKPFDNFNLSMSKKIVTKLIITIIKAFPSTLNIQLDENKLGYSIYFYGIYYPHLFDENLFRKKIQILNAQVQSKENLIVLSFILNPMLSVTF